ncbi:MAG: DUF4349 domain-containing protein [Microgenomates group bacterium]
MIDWLKKNWAIIALLVIGILWLKNNYATAPIMPYSGGGVAMDSVGFAAPSTKMMAFRESAPTDSANRIVIQDTSLSLQVKDVSQEITTIETLAKGMGGFLVNSNLSKPDSAASGSITVRVPEASRTDALNAFKKLAVKVVSESVYGNDVTDSYVDLQAQLDVLTKTKVKYEDILGKAVRVEDLLNVQQQLTNLQQQIDSIKGQQKYYEQSAKLTKISIYLSTDELALPYAPTNTWRPAVVFKEAVRSLIGSLRSLGNLLIWGIVYVPVLIPVGLVWWYFKRRD